MDKDKRDALQRRTHVKRLCILVLSKQRQSKQNLLNKLPGADSGTARG